MSLNLVDYVVKRRITEAAVAAELLDWHACPCLLRGPMICLWVAISTPSPITTIRAIGKPKEPNCMCYSMFFGSYFAILGLGYHTASAPCLLRAAVG